MSDLRTIPKRLAYDYEEGLEKEDDPSLQRLWANLLVNVTAPKTRIDPLKIYGDILALQLPFCFEVGSLSGSLVSSAPE